MSFGFWENINPTLSHISQRGVVVLQRICSVSLLCMVSISAKNQPKFKDEMDARWFFKTRPFKVDPCGVPSTSALTVFFAS